MDTWVQYFRPVPIPPKAQGSLSLYGEGSSLPHFVRGSGTGNLVQKTEGHLHEMSAKPPDV